MYVRVLCGERESGSWIVADVQEAFVAGGGPLEPAESQCDGIGDRKGYGDEFECFEGAPETFEVAETSREEQEGQ